MFCDSCKVDSQLHHETNGVVYLLCGHTARRNPDPSLDRTWEGFIDGDKVVINLRDKELVPLGDIISIQKWTNGKCSECFSDLIPMEESFGAYRCFRCGHMEGSKPLRSQNIEEHTRDNAPEYTTGHEARPRCQVCNNPGGDYLVSQLPENVRKCGHGYTKYPDKEPVKI